jgi:flagellar basal-body rod protein FlgB
MNMNLDILRLATGLAAHAAQRQGVIAENIAHADSPGYRARDVAEFSTVAGGSGGLAMRTTRPGHIGAEKAAGLADVSELRNPATESPNGNTVSLEDQMIRAADVQHSHDLALGIYRKSLDILRIAGTRR